MKINKSPWIDQLGDHAHPHIFDGDFETDIAIVGAGIAGLASAYFILEKTDLSIALVESRFVAHGATGHNAGVLVAEFERPFGSIVKEFGLKMASNGLHKLQDSWMLLDLMVKNAELSLPIYQFTGYSGFSREGSILTELEDALQRRKAGVRDSNIYIAKEWKDHLHLEARFDGLYEFLPHVEIMGLLETKHPQYVAAVSNRNGAMNSALFCQQLANFLRKKYRDRITIFEESKLDTLKLFTDKTLLTVNNQELKARKTLLCTNGFENFNIINMVGPQINKHFHETVREVVGFMVGFFVDYNPKNIVHYFYPSDVDEDDFGENYIYISRREYELGGLKRSLVSVGGPEEVLTNRYYHRGEQDHPDSAVAEINKFLDENFLGIPEKIEHIYRWHGVMAYTPNMIRAVGADKVNPNLLYNLGCNGIGLLPSIMGANMIGDILTGKESSSIFTPR